MSAILLGAVALASAAPAMAATNAALLIDASTLAGQPRLSGCDRAMQSLRARLDAKGVASTLLTAPTTADIRAALLRFGGGHSGLVAVCGFASEDAGDIFILGSDVAAGADLGLEAVSVRAFSRVNQAATATILLDLHPVAGGPSLDAAASAWAQDATLPGNKRATVERDAAAATLADDAEATGDASSPAPAPSTPPPLPPAPTPTVVPPAPKPSDSPASATPPPVAAAPPVAPPTEAPAPATPPPSAAAETAPPPAFPAPAPQANETPAAPTSSAPRPPTVSNQGVSNAAAADKAGKNKTGSNKAAAKKLGTHAPASHTDAAVRRAQVSLLARGLFYGRVTGVDSAATQAAIRHYQGMIGHRPTGTLTPDETKLLTSG